MEFLTPYNPKKYQKVSTSDRLNQTENLPSSRLDMNDSLIIKLRIKVTKKHYVGELITKINLFFVIFLANRTL